MKTFSTFTGFAYDGSATVVVHTIDNLWFAKTGKSSWVLIKGLTKQNLENDGNTIRLSFGHFIRGTDYTKKVPSLKDATYSQYAEWSLSKMNNDLIFGV
jgi:hypothetical protein